jgi:hypothetical protein
MGSAWLRIGSQRAGVDAANNAAMMPDGVLDDEDSEWGDRTLFRLRAGMRNEMIAN